MSDQELLDLLSQTPPEDLSSEQLEVLKLRLSESAELRRLLIDELGMASYLDEALRRADTSLAQVVTAAALIKPPRKSVWAAIAYLAVCFGVVYGAASWLQ